MKPSEFQITVQHEIEHPATDVVEAVIWLLQRQLKAVSIIAVVEHCTLMDYHKARAAARNLVLTGRIEPVRERNERHFGPKWTTKYKVPTNIRPRLVENTLSVA